MRNDKITFLIILATVLSCVTARADDDLRVKYGTRSLDVARHLDAAMKLDQDKKPEEALKEILLAVKGDPNCALAWFWNANIDEDLGDMDGCIDAYKHCVALDNEPSNRSICTTAKTNLGLTLGQLKRLDESAYWFSRSIVDDSENHAGEKAKAYRNLALTLHFENQDFAASLAAITGHEIDPEHVEEGMIDEFMKAGQGQEGARVLCLEQQPPKLKPRTEASSLELVDQATPIADRVSRLFADPRGRYVLAMTEGDHYYNIEIGSTGAVKTNKIAITGGPIDASCLAGGKLYLITGKIAKLQQLDPMTGAVGKSWEIGGAASKSLAVLPSKNAAFFPAGDEIKWLDLNDGKVTDTNLPGQVVAADPTEKYVYARYKDEQAANQNMVIIDGHPIFIETDHFDWEQTTLFKYYVSPHMLLPAAIRINAAANGYDPIISPDGLWVSCPGGGGWRPNAGNGGYNIPVYPTGDFAKVQNCFALDAYPKGCAFNPATQEFVGVRGQDARVYDLATETPEKSATTLQGKFSGLATWTGDGNFLILGTDGNGVSIHQEKLSTDEAKLGKTWWKQITPTETIAAKSTGKPAVAAGVPQPVAALTTFQPTTDRAALQKSLTAALASTATNAPLSWRDNPAYTANADSITAINDQKGQATGIRIYSMKTALAKDPQSMPLEFSLAAAMAEGGQLSAAKDRFLDVVHHDAGRTDLTIRSLTDLSKIYTKDGQDTSAADCLTHALLLDRANPETAGALASLLQKLKFTAEAKQLSSDSAASAGSTGSAKVHALPAAPADAKALLPSKLFQTTSPSVVLIHCGDAAGTGVCVEKDGFILTSLHVVSKPDAIEVYPFRIENGKAHRLGKLSAEIVARSEKDDLAILQVHNAPATMVPLPVADTSPAIGEKVFALGNPGLGADTLDLSFSEGIVSSADRTVHGNSYLQHTAAVNPGNSGGPLLNESGCVVAVVCLKADLDGVSFATPVNTIRAFFIQNSDDAGK